jgi:hypothetical protein
MQYSSRAGASHDWLLTVARVDDQIHGQMDTAFPQQLTVDNVAAIHASCDPPSLR